MPAPTPTAKEAAAPRARAASLLAASAPPAGLARLLLALAAGGAVGVFFSVVGAPTWLCACIGLLAGLRAAASSVWRSRRGAAR